MYRSGTSQLIKLRHCFMKHNGKEQTEMGTRYFKSNDDIGTDTLLKKYRRYR